MPTASERIRDPVCGMRALIKKWGVDSQNPVFQPLSQLKKERVRGRILRGQDANPRRTG